MKNKKRIFEATERNITLTNIIQHQEAIKDLEKRCQKKEDKEHE